MKLQWIIMKEKMERTWTLYTAFTMFHKLVKEGYSPAMNAVACMYYNREDSSQNRLSGGVDLAKHYWNAAARLGNEAAKENINKLIRHQ